MANRGMHEGMMLLSGLVGFFFLTLLDVAICGGIDLLWPGAGPATFAPLFLAQVIAIVAWGMWESARERRREKAALRLFEEQKQLELAFEERGRLAEDTMVEVT